MNCLAGMADATYRIFSPDRKLELIVNAGETLQYRLNREGGTVVEPSTIGLQVAGERM